MLSSDDVLNEIFKTLNILEDCKIKGSSPPFKNDNLEEESESSEVFLSSSVEFSANVFMCSQSELGKSITDAHNPNYLEFQKTIEHNETVLKMYKYCLEEIRNFQDPEKLSCIMDYFADIMCPSNINITTEKMKSVVSHIKTISAEGAKLKQVLRSDILNDVWKINKDYHKTVIKFFKMASEFVKDIGVLISSLESTKGYTTETSKILQEKEMKVLAVLHGYMDTLIELRNFVRQHSIRSSD